jgi:SAM-dependent methyltransferase
MALIGSFEFNPLQFFRLAATGAVAWAPTMAAMWLVGAGRLSVANGLVVGAGAMVVSLLLIAFRITHRRRQPIKRQSEGSRVDQWWRVADPKDNFANRWAMYEDLTAWLSGRDWRGKVVAEFGGTNEVLRTFMPGAEYRSLPYPEYDLQDLRNVADATFDLAVLDQTLEHIAHPERALGEVRRVLKPGGIAVVTTPFLVPVHTGSNYGDYYRWTPQGLAVTLDRTGFDARIRGWGGRRAAAVLIEEDMYMSAEAAQSRGISLSADEDEAEFPVTVWAIGTARPQSTPGSRGGAAAGG